MFRVEGLGFRVQDLGFRVQSVGEGHMRVVYVSYSGGCIGVMWGSH